MKTLCNQFSLTMKSVILFKQLRIYAQPLQIKTAEYAADTTKVIFDYFEEYFNMSYSIPKLGMFLCCIKLINEIIL